MGATRFQEACVHCVLRPISEFRFLDSCSITENPLTDWLTGKFLTNLVRKKLGRRKTVLLWQWRRTSEENWFNPQCDWLYGWRAGEAGVSYYWKTTITEDRRQQSLVLGGTSKGVGERRESASEASQWELFLEPGPSPACFARRLISHEA